MTGSLRRLVLAGLVLLCSATLLSFPAGAAANFTSVSAAHGIFTMTSAPGVVPLGLSVDGGDATAQASVNSLQNSTGFAASPDSGSASRTGTGTVAGQFPAGTVPSSPLIATSSYPGTPHAGASQGAITLSADSTATTSKATAATGTGSAASAQQSATTTVNATGSVSDANGTSDSMATVDGVSVSGVLAISHVHVEAHASRTASGALSRSSSVDVGAATVAGQPVTIDASGVHAAGGTTALPTSALTAALTAQGVSVAVTPATNTTDGVVAGGVRVMVVQTAAAGGTSTTYLLGTASASVAASVVPDVSPVGSQVTPPAVTPPPLATPSATARSTPAKSSTSRSAAPAQTASSTFAAPAAPSAVTTSRAPAVAAVPSASSGLPSSAAPARADVSPRLAARTGQPGGRLDAFDLYLVVAAAGLVTLGAAQLLRHLGVKSAWM